MFCIGVHTYRPTTLVQVPVLEVLTFIIALESRYRDTFSQVWNFKDDSSKPRTKHRVTKESNIIMSGQRSADTEGTAESVAPGCSMRETPRNRDRRSTPPINITDNTYYINNNNNDILGGTRTFEGGCSSTTTTGAASGSGQMTTRTTTGGGGAATDGGLAVFTWGRGEDGQLGLGDTSDQDEPTYVDALRGVGVQQIACGSGHTVVLTTDGEVFTWGRGDDGRLGHGDNGWKYVPRIIQSLTGQVVVQVTCGSYHTAAVTGNGDLYTWGGGMYGKLGHGNEAGCSTPKRVDGLIGVTVSKIACGSRHTAVVTDTGVLYTWGDKENGVAGHGDTEGHQYTPRIVERLRGKCVVQLSACGFHTGCLTQTSELYTWGEGKFGRLGHSSESNCHVPRLVESLIGRKPHQISCGGFHTAVVTEDGQLYTFGGGEHGQLGHNDRVNKLKPTLVQALEGVFISQITCGWSHSVALTSPDGRVYTWGNSDHGKLGHGSGRKVTVPQLVDKLNDYRVVRVASYNEHTATLVEPTIVVHHHGSGDHTGSSTGSTSVGGVFFGTSANSTPAAALHSVPVSALYSQQFRSLVNDEEFSDVTFLVGENTEPVYAHRAILVQRCETFAAMFRSGMRESIEKTISIPTIPRKAFLLLLEYIYTDTVKVDLENAIDLYNAADLYHLERLREMCLNVVRRNLSLYNSGPLLQQATDLHCHSLKDVCMKYVVDNFDAFSKTDGIRQISHDILLEAISKR